MPMPRKLSRKVRVLGLFAMGGALLLALAWVLLRGQPAAGPPSPPPLSAASSQRPDAAPAPPPDAFEGEEGPPPVENPSGSVLPPDSPARIDTPVVALVRGEVVAPMGNPFPSKATVWLRPQEKGAAEPRSMEVGPASRSFRFEAVPFGDWKLQVEAPGFQSNPVLISRDAGHPDGHVLLSLLPATHIKGRALDERGRPVADLKITAIPVLKNRALMVEPHFGITDAEGRFDIIGVRQGIYRVHAGPPRSPIGEEREVQLAGREAWLELVVPVFGKASVTVTDQKTGKGLEGIRVVVQGSRFFDASKTDGKGRAIFPTLLPGEYAFTGYGSTRYRRTVQRAIVQAEQLTQVEIRMVPLHSDQ